MRPSSPSSWSGFSLSWQASPRFHEPADIRESYQR